jgi:hypothetical protein
MQPTTLFTSPFSLNLAGSAFFDTSMQPAAPCPDQEFTADLLGLQQNPPAVINTESHHLYSQVAPQPELHVQHVSEVCALREELDCIVDCLDNFKCCVCFAVFDEQAHTPRSLTCGYIMPPRNYQHHERLLSHFSSSCLRLKLLSRHCICHTCAADMLKGTAARALSCPTCRIVTQAPHGAALLPKNFALIPNAKVANALLKRPLADGGADSPAKRLGACAPPAAAASSSACSIHPTKACIYLCLDCQKAVCEICCMSSLTGCCKSHQGYLIHDIPEIMACRLRDEWEQ